MRRSSEHHHGHSLRRKLYDAEKKLPGMLRFPTIMIIAKFAQACAIWTAATLQSSRAQVVACPAGYEHARNRTLEAESSEKAPDNGTPQDDTSAGEKRVDEMLDD